MLFGLPGDEWELPRGRIRWTFPFLERDVAEADFAAWTETLCRWGGGARPCERATTTANGSPRRVVEFDGVELSLYPQPIILELPMVMEVFEALYSSY